MPKNSPEDLDKLFQQESDEFQFDYNKKSWSEMEKLLDKDDRRRLLWWWIGGIAALFLVSAICFFRNDKAEIAVANSTLNKEETLKVLEKEKLITTSFQKKNFDEKNINELNSSSKVASQKSPKNDDNIFSNNKVNTLKSVSENLFDEKNKNKKEDVEHLILKKNNPIVNDVFLEKTIEKITENEIESDSEKTVLKNTSVSLIPSLKIFVKRNNIVDIGFLKTDSTESQIKPLSVLNKNILLFGLLVGSESSTTNQGSFSKLNWKVGAQFEYHFLQKMSISLGANFLKKRYKTIGKEYSPPKGFWTDAIAPQSIDADCNILEIPLNIGFFPKINNGNGFYIKLGLTSIFMLNEQYDYSYALSVSDQLLNWKVKNKNRHWFGVGEFSMGYQRVLFQKTLLQFEPYLQIPLKGIGHGKVKLWSLGLNLKFNFQLKK